MKLNIIEKDKYNHSLLSVKIEEYELIDKDIYFIINMNKIITECSSSILIEGNITYNKSYKNKDIYFIYTTNLKRLGLYNFNIINYNDRQELYKDFFNYSYTNIMNFNNKLHEILIYVYATYHYKVVDYLINHSKMKLSDSTIMIDNIYKYMEEYTI